MQKIIKSCLKTASSALLFSFIWMNSTAAQIIDTGAMEKFTSDVGVEAGFQQVSLGYVVAMLIRGFLGLVALIFVILIILAGVRWMNSAGNEETIKKAQDTIKNSVIGLIIILAAWAITYFIFKQLPFSGPSGGGMGAV